MLFVKAFLTTFLLLMPKASCLLALSDVDRTLQHSFGIYSCPLHLFHLCTWHVVILSLLHAPLHVPLRTQHIVNHHHHDFCTSLRHLPASCTSCPGTFKQYIPKKGFYFTLKNFALNILEKALLKKFKILHTLRQVCQLTDP